MDIDSQIKYYLGILSSGTIQAWRLKMKSEINRLYQFIQYVKIELQRRRSQADQAKAQYQKLASSIQKLHNQKNGSQTDQMPTKLKQFNTKQQAVAQYWHNRQIQNLLIDFNEDQQEQIQFQQISEFNSELPKNKLCFQEIDQLKKANGGILNIGNSCYLNSALQCLYQTQYLNEQLKRKDGLFSDYLNKQFTRLYMSMCKRLEIKRLYNPSMIKKIIEKHNPIFQGDSQHDSGEVINTILNIIDQETNRVVSPKLNKIEYKQQDSDQILCNKYSRKNRQKSYSVTDTIFSGFYKTAYHCNSCKKVKRLFEKFTVVYLPLTRQGTYLSELSECLKQFSQSQSLDWDCLKCGNDTPHSKTMQIFKPGKIIIFCLKRFNENNTKIKIALDVPLELNLNKQTHFVSQKNYILYAAIIHKGNQDSGHYVAFCYDYRAKCWTECDDSSVTVVSEAEFLTNIRNAYLLFYRQQKLQERVRALLRQN